MMTRSERDKPIRNIMLQTYALNADDFKRGKLSVDDFVSKMKNDWFSSCVINGWSPEMAETIADEIESRVCERIEGMECNQGEDREKISDAIWDVLEQEASVRNARPNDDLAE